MKSLRELGTTPPTTTQAIIEECKKAKTYEEKYQQQSMQLAELEHEKKQIK